MVSYATHVPFISGTSWDLSIDGYIAPGGEKFLDVANSAVAPQYFATMQIPILRGREFDEHDTRKGTPVAIVNETLARRYIVPAGDLTSAIGRVIRLREGFPIQIVGIAKDSNYGNIGTPPIPVFYTPYQQEGGSAATFTIRAKGNAAALAPEVRQEIASLDPGVSPTLVNSLTGQVSSQGLFFPRIVSILCGAFGMVALLLAAIGIYGVVSFMVARRTHEIGIRMALGAQRSSVLRIILASGLSLAATGMAIGIAGSFALTPLVRSMLIGVSPWDPVTFVVIATVMLVVTVLASLVPASRATHVQPMDALHYE
jgi:predicted permease